MGRKLVNLSGKRFRRLTVLNSFQKRSMPGVNKKYTYWLCKCDCGTELYVQASRLVGGYAGSCGCLRGDVNRSRATHGCSVGQTTTPEYRSWLMAKGRCYNQNDKEHYFDYGGRGVKMCDRWKDNFAAFLFDMGEKPTPRHTLDRIDTNGNYELGNCRWATPKVQSRNRRNNVLLEYKGKTQCKAAWIEQLNITRNRLDYLLRERGLSLKEIIECAPSITFPTSTKECNNDNE